MALTTDKILARLRILAVVTFFVSVSISCFAAKPLDPKDKAKLTEMVKTQYQASGMEGSTVYKFKGRMILVTIVGVKQSPNAQRVAQVKASRSAGEYLQSSTNKSVSVYEVVDKESYAMTDNSGIASNAATSEITQSTSDNTAVETEEIFTDKMVQSSMSMVNHIEPLSKIGLEGNQVIFAYYMIVK